jgi:large subunit ribosomal protein L11
MNPEDLTDCAGKITIKHVYEIAKMKQNDPKYDCVPLSKICEDVIDAAHSCGVEVVHRLDVAQYAEFLVEREKVVAKQLAELEEKRQARMLRTT